jgi:glycosyltransferase involved in cell wall biosynthesis
MLLPSIGAGAAGLATPALATLVTALSRHADVRVFALRQPTPPPDSAFGAAELRGLDGAQLRLRALAWRALRTLAAEHRRRRFDVLHAVWLHEPGTLALLAGTVLRIPTLLSVGGAEVASVPEIGYGGALTPSARRVQRLALRRAGLVSGGSHYVLDLARNLCPARHAAEFRWAPLPVDADAFTPNGDHAPRDAAPRLLHVGSLIPVKDQDLLLRAFAHIVRAQPDACLSIAGEDPFGRRAELEQLAASLGVGERVRWLGRVPHDDLPALYCASDLLLLTSWHESQCLAVLEAAACGLPVVGTAVGVVPELAPDAATVVAGRDPRALADAALALVADPARYAAQRAAARARVERDYAVAPATARFLALYAELARR